MAECYLCCQDSSNKIDRTKPTVSNNVALLDSTGNIIDSGKQLTPEGIGAELAGAGVYSGFTEISGNSDLNTYTKCGYYSCSTATQANTLSNCPTDNQFLMIVTLNGGYGDPESLQTTGTGGRSQIVIPSSGNIYRRDISKFGDGTISFYDWESFALTKDISSKADKKVPSAADNVALLDSTGNIADSGKQLTPESIGADAAGTGLYASFTYIPANSDLNDYTACGYYQQDSTNNGATIANNPTGDAFILIVSNGVGASDHDDITGKTWRFRLQRAIDLHGKEYVRWINTDGSGTINFSDWRKFADTTDTVAAAGGVVDYNKADKQIKIGWNGDSLTTSNLKYLAGYNSDGNIKDVAVEAVVSLLYPYYGFTSNDGGLSLGNQDILNVVYSPSVIRFGIWTPVIEGVSSYSYQTGWYLTIGSTCVLGWYVYGSFAGSTTSRFKITGCPFTPLQTSGGGGGCSGYTSANNIIFTGYELQKNANIYPVGQETSTSSPNRWQSNNIYQKASGDTSSYGTIAFKITPVED